MAYIPNMYREPSTKLNLYTTGKEPTIGSDSKESAYWALASRIEDSLGSGPFSISTIYHEVTGKMGLSADDTNELVAGAVSYGYLKQGRS